jgi:hypothetical protein
MVNSRAVEPSQAQNGFLERTDALTSGAGPGGREDCSWGNGYNRSKIGGSAVFRAALLTTPRGRMIIHPTSSMQLPRSG